MPEDKRDTPPPADPSAAAPPAAPFVPRRPTLRDALLTAVPVVLLGLVMRYHGDVVTPRGDDPAHPLGHFSALWHSGHVPGGVWIGLLLTLVATVGLLGLLGDSPLDLRGDETLAREEAGARPWYLYEGAWLVGFCALLYLPLAGAFGLWDPWETHYGEVAREILARDDWITLWWGQEGWFMSKPILIFWIGALGMGAGSAFGLPFWRDMGPGGHEWFIRVPIVLLAIGAVYSVYRAVAQTFGRRAALLSGLVLATMPHWFFLTHQAMTDMPFVAPLVIAMAALMLAVTTDSDALVSPRRVRIAGLSLRISFWHVAVGAIIMVALPQVLYLLTRPMLIGCAEDADRSCEAVLTASRLGPIQFPIEQYWSGSAANSAYKDLAATVPGSPAWEDRYNQVPFMTSFVQGVLWTVLGGWLLGSFRRQRRLQALRFAMVYLFGAISFMGKGPAGLGVPEIVLIGFMITSGRWGLLPRIRFFQSIGIYLLCGFPWYIAIYCRLGNEFFDRFVVHDLINRAFAGVHGDTGTFRYFVWQLGYAMFPWTGFVPAALVGWRLYLSERATEAQKDLVRVTVIWFLVTFTLFSLMVTKFHHYIFPAVPSAALLVGLVLHRMLGERRLPSNVRALAVGATTFGGTAALVLGVTNFFGAWHGAVSREAPFELPKGSPILGVILALAGLGAIAAAWGLARRAEIALDPTEGEAHGAATGVPSELPSASRAAFRDVGVDQRGDFAPSDRFTRTGLGATAIGAAVLLAIVARDLGMGGAARPAGYERLIHLFVYNYDRTFPTRSFDYHAILSGFGVVAVIVAGAIAVPFARRHAVRVMVALAACFAFWGLDKYMIDLSNHWSQRNLFERYYATRHVRTSVGVGENARYWADPIAAFQMNWKGENFYTGNHAAMLECGLPLCRDRTPEWLQRHRGERVFFVTEHSRIGSVTSQVRTAGGNAHAVTTEFDNNKFVLIEAQL